jgi:quinol monooxygenase YgiN
LIQVKARAAHWQTLAADGMTVTGGLTTMFELSAHMTVRPGQLEGFKRQAAEIIRLTKERDTQTLRYDWFITKDGTECEVRELYESAEGLIEHKAHIGEALGKLFARYADNHFMTIYGDPTPQLTALVRSLHMENQIKWFSFVEGLSSTPSVPQSDRRPQSIGV